MKLRREICCYRFGIDVCLDTLGFEHPKNGNVESWWKKLTFHIEFEKRNKL